MVRRAVENVAVLVLVLLIPDELQVDPQVLEAAVAARKGNRADYDPDLPSRRLGEWRSSPTCGSVILSKGVLRRAPLDPRSLHRSDARAPAKSSRTPQSIIVFRRP